MNRKYYLRGLGVGIVITAIIMGIVASNRKPSLTDEEIIIKAKALGMVENEDLAEAIEDTKKETEETLRKEIEEELRTEIEAKYAQMAQAVSGVNNGENDGEAAEEENKEQVSEKEAETVTFNVSRGETPQSIDERLKECGLIDAEANFERYLLANGYDRIIVAKEYEIPIDADMETIAQIITKRKTATETEPTAETAAEN